MTYVRIVKKNKRRLPEEFKQEDSTTYRLSKQTTIISYVPKKVKLLYRAMDGTEKIEVIIAHNTKIYRGIFLEYLSRQLVLDHSTQLQMS